MQAEYENSESYEVAPQVEAEQNAPTEQNERELETQNREAEQEKNWRAVREKLSHLEADNKRKDEIIEKFLKTLETPKQPEEVEEELPDDDYANVGVVKKTARKTIAPLEKKVEELEKKLAQKEQQELFNDLRRKYSDFDDVVNAETIAFFEEKEPELANSISEVKDPVKMGIQTYKYIKALNMLDELPSRRQSKEVQKKLEKNEKTVQSPVSFDKRPMAQAFKLTAAEQSKLYEEMMGYASLASSAPPVS